MNNCIEVIMNRRSVRAYEDKKIDDQIKNSIIEAALRSPSAGNMMMYSIIEIEDEEIKNTLSKTCDNQAFIAKAPWLLVFIADFSRWFKYYDYYGCINKNDVMPEESDLLMAVNDAMIAAQTTVIAAESFSLGSCYIGDIIENFETHKKILNLPKYTFPITMLCIGYPTESQKIRKQPPRLDKKYVVFKNKYRNLEKEDFENMYKDEYYKNLIPNAKNYAEHMYIRKFSAAFTMEMRRSVKEALKEWKKE